MAGGREACIDYSPCRGRQTCRARADFNHGVYRRNGNEQDLLARGLTKETQILRVPLRLALFNAAMMAVVMLVCLVFSLPAISLLVVLSGFLVNHLVLMIVTSKDDRAVGIFLVDKVNCTQHPLARTKGGVRIYQPLENRTRQALHEGWRGVLYYLLKKEKVKGPLR